MRTLDEMRENTGIGWWVPIGWNDIVEELHAKLEEVVPGYHLVQAKEKFAQLRYYLDLSEYDVDARERAHKLIAEAEAASGVTCQVCGDLGETHVVGYTWATLCNEDLKRYQERTNRTADGSWTSDEENEFWETNRIGRKAT